MVNFSNNSSSQNFSPQKYKISVDDYHRMGALGLFKNKPKVELVDGEIYTMSPITPNHAAHVDKISRFFTKVLFDDVLIRTQGSVKIDDHSEPEPDIALLRMDEKFYLEAHPTPDDIFLIIEVAIFSVRQDRNQKLRNYAQSNIPEYWIIIPKKQSIEVYRKPEKGKYTEKTIYSKKDKWTFKKFKLKIKGSDILI